MLPKVPSPVMDKPPKFPVCHDLLWQPRSDLLHSNLQYFHLHASKMQVAGFSASASDAVAHSWRHHLSMYTTPDRRHLPVEEIRGFRSLEDYYSCSYQFYLYLRQEKKYQHGTIEGYKSAWCQSPSMMGCQLVLIQSKLAS